MHGTEHTMVIDHAKDLFKYFCWGLGVYQSVQPHEFILGSIQIEYY
jgi:hypothetical protein